jgi:hypothetical protein
MAKVKIQGHASGTGILTVTAPNTSTDRTITLPDATGTLLNSDGSAASLTALNATNLGSGTVPTARLGSGTASSSTVLYGDQTYKAEPTGALVKISQESPSGVSEIVFDSSDITSTYKTYLFVFDGLRVAVDATNFLSQISTDNGSSYINSAMSRVTWQENDTGTSIEDTTDDETGGSIFIARNGIGNNHTNGESLGGTAWMFGSQDTGAHCYLMVRSVFVGNSGQTFQEVLTTVIRDKTAINNVRFYAGSGNLAGGTITLYGLT